jgi:hypothetical protein
MPDEDTTLRRCQRCKVEKPLDTFHRSKDRPLGRAYVCKACIREHVRTPAERERRRRLQVKRYEAIREKFYAMKDRPCEDCGGRFPHYVMEFDHPDRSVKTGTISQMAMAGITPRLLAEIAKTALVCSNCHRVRTRRQYEAGEWKSGRPRFDGTHHTDDVAS